VKYRSRTDIISEILKLAENGNSKTKIMYGAYLSYDQMKDYLSVMLQNELLEKKGVKCRTTKKGLQFIKTYENIDQMLELVKTKNDSG
jgi:predicted transcriptional regulator